MLPQTQLRPIAASQHRAHPAHLPAAMHGSFGAMDLIGTQMTFGPNEEIFGENEPATYVYKVTKGAVRTAKILSDGRRQIGAFYLPGDIFGLEMGDEHQFSAEAINHATVTMIRRSAVLSLAARDCEAARELWTVTSRELRRVQDHMMLLVKSAQQRVACFCSKCPSGSPPLRRSSCRCRARILPIIWNSPSKRCRGRCRNWYPIAPSGCLRRAASCSAIASRYAN